MDNEEIICNCMQITRGEIIEAIKAGNLTIEEIGDETEAGTVCGSCHDELEDIIKEVVG
ncbi:MAG: (2Fe-2S)-binding protein [Bacteroidetes bacterium]|nr:(2Fe-2S)-binding protein [Bacteroidota bacterium]